MEKSDHRHLLRARGARPRPGRGAEQRDERAAFIRSLPSHVIPAEREARGPESITQVPWYLAERRTRGDAGGYGFRARRFAATRNDDTESHSITSSARRRVGKGALLCSSTWAKSCARHSPSKTGVNALVAHAAAIPKAILPTLRMFTRSPRRRAGPGRRGLHARAPS